MGLYNIHTSVSMPTIRIHPYIHHHTTTHTHACGIVRADTYIVHTVKGLTKLHTIVKQVLWSLLALHEHILVPLDPPLRAQVVMLLVVPPPSSHGASSASRHSRPPQAMHSMYTFHQSACATNDLRCRKNSFNKQTGGSFPL